MRANPGLGGTSSYSLSEETKILGSLHEVNLNLKNTLLAINQYGICKEILTSTPVRNIFLASLYWEALPMNAP